MLRRPSTVDSIRIVRERALEVHGPTGGKREAIRTRRTCRNSEKKVVLKKELKQKKVSHMELSACGRLLANSNTTGSCSRFRAYRLGCLDLRLTATATDFERPCTQLPLPLPLLLPLRLLLLLLATATATRATTASSQGHQSQCQKCFNLAV